MVGDADGVFFVGRPGEGVIVLASRPFTQKVSSTDDTARLGTIVVDLSLFPSIVTVRVSFLRLKG